MDRHSQGAAAGDDDQPEQSEAIIRDLKRKLDDLEHKVQTYRHEMATEFQRYYKQTLLNAAVPGERAITIQESLSTNLDNCYPILAQEIRKQIRAADELSAISTTNPNRDSGGKPLELEPLAGRADFRPSPPSSGAVFGAAVASQGSPHEREKEFQGLFTPFFLPLLDSSPVSPTNPPTSPPVQSATQASSADSATADASTSTTSPPLAQRTVAGSGVESAGGTNVATVGQMQGSPRRLQVQDMDGSNTTGGLGSGTSQLASGSELPSAATSPPPLAGRPVASDRRNTDDTLSSALSSALSDKSESHAPKSALRRSSSCSKPQHSPRRVRFEVKGAEVLPTASPQPSDFPTPRPSSPVSTDQPRTFDEIVGEPAFNEDDRPSLPPRKISSTEKLRLLSREPLDSSTTWTTVNTGPEDSEGSAPSSMKSSPSSTPAPAEPQPAKQPAFGTASSTARQEESDESSDEDFLAMAKPKSKAKKASFATGDGKTPKRETTADERRPKDRLVKQEDEKDQMSSEDYDEDDDMFHFETGGLSAPPRPKKKPPPLKEDVPEPATPENELDAEVRTPQIAPPGVAIPEHTGSGPTTPTASRFQIGSLGSYKGRPVVMPVVTNPEIHAQAAQQGNFHTFVGGIDGRSGVDDGDMNSFRASFAQTGFSGTPRSLSERMMIEDAMEEREREKNGA